VNIIFAGTPEIAAHCLSTLLQSSHRILAVYTQPDRPAGRGKKLTPSPVKLLAQAHDIPVFQPEKLTELPQSADIMVVVAYGLILPEAVLKAPRYGCINVHTSLLPKYRGAAPMQAAILQGEKITGVSVMQLDKGCDTGPVLLQKTCAISPKDTSETLLATLTPLGAEALLETLEGIEKGSLKACPQDSSQASYAPKIQKQDACIDWNQSATQIDAAIRAYQPWPIAYSFIQGTRIHILEANPLDQTVQAKPGTVITASKQELRVATGQGVLQIQTLQLPGKKPVSLAALFNGHPDFFQAGMIFDVTP
jgi:methionyl-tRNA formyltransferase